MDACTSDGRVGYISYMKQMVRGALIAMVVTLVAALGFYYFQRYSVILSNPQDAISGDAALILEIKGGHDIAVKLENSSLWKLVKQDSSFQAFEQFASQLDSALSTNETMASVWKEKIIYLSLHPSGSRTTDWLWSTDLPPGVSAQKATSIVQTHFKESTWLEREFESTTIHESEKPAISFTIYNGIFCYSRSALLVENAIRQLSSGIPLRKQKSFNSIYQPVSRNGQATAYLHFPAIRDLFTDATTPTGNIALQLLGRTGEWSGGNLQSNATGLTMSGASSPSDTSDLIANLSNTINRPEDLLEMLPGTTAFFTWFAFDSSQATWKHLQSNNGLFEAGPLRTQQQQEVEGILGSKVDSKLLHRFTGECCLFVTEPATTDVTNHQIIAVRVQDPDRLTMQLESLRAATKGSTVERHGNVVISTMPECELASIWFGKLGTGVKRTCFARIGNTFFFANQSSAIISILNTFTDKKTLLKDPSMRRQLQLQGDRPALLTYIDRNRCQQLTRVIFDDQRANSLLTQNNFLNNLGSLSLKITKVNNRYTTSVRINATEQKIQPAALTWATVLDTALEVPPHVLYTGPNRTLPLIAAQDQLNQLYLILPSGIIRIKKPLPDKLMGRCHPVDLFKNGIIHFAFATKQQLWVIDQDGNNAGNFPIQLPAPAMSELCCSYDANGLIDKLYIVCENGKLYGYETDGRPIEGFQQKFNVQQLSSPLVVIGNKICLHTNKKVFVVNESGKATAVPIEKPVTRIELTRADTADRNNVLLLTNEGMVLELDVVSMSLRTLSPPSGAFRLNAVNQRTTSRMVLLADSTKSWMVRAQDSQPSSNDLPAADCAFAINLTYESDHWGLYSKNKGLLWLYDNNGNMLPGLPIPGNGYYCDIRLPDQADGSYTLTATPEGSIVLYKLEE